jgi:cupin 2 domain-containing protein
MAESGNLFADIPRVSETEQFADLYAASGIRIERIVSTGQATPTLEWLAQDWTEWVALLTGAAAIQLEGEPGPRTRARRLAADPGSQASPGGMD